MIFSCHYSSLQCHTILPHETFLIINVETNRAFSKEQHIFKTEIFCNIINIFTVTFDQFNVKGKLRK